MKSTHRLAAAGTAGLLTIGALGILPAAAQDSGEAPPATEDRHPAAKERREQRKAALAEQFGVSVEALEAARRAAHEAVVAEFGEIDPANPPGDDERAARRAAFDQALADALGVSVDDVSAGRLAVLTARLDQAVANGRLSQEEADELLAAYNDGTLRELLRERFGDRFGERPRPLGRR